LDIIEDPNVVGHGCNYVNKGLNLKKRTAVYGLPPFIQSYFVAQIETNDICLDDIGRFRVDTDEIIDEVIWDFGDGTTSTDIEAEHQYTSAGNYVVNATIVSGFNTYYLTETIEVFDTPIIVVNESWSLCNNEPLTLSLKSSHDAYLWSTGDTSSEIVVDEAGIYSVTVYNYWPDGIQTCEATISIEVIESGLPELLKIEVEDWSSNRNTIQVNAQGYGDYEYSLDNINYQDSNEFNNLLSGDYMVYVRDKNGCGYLNEDIYILNYPKYFTPNGDGNNEYWKIKFSESEPDITIRIFDRYGKFLKELNPNSIGWDGMYKGTRLSSSDYWFIVNRPSKGKMYKGHFTLKR
tara:strand:- start:3370 stop:4416 length:1047 start_codon:yes stop_codon:yes gene_type:complete